MKILVEVNGKKRSYTSVKDAIKFLTGFEENLTTTGDTISPKVGEWFTITPKDIDWAKVEKACKETGADSLWENILWAKEQIPTNKKYQGKIKTYIPVKDWESMTEKEMREKAKQIGDEMTDEVVQCLEFAQRIHNGEAVKTLTEKADTLPYYRMIVTRTGGTGLVGGASAYDFFYPPADIDRNVYFPDDKNYTSVPSVARFSK